MQRQQATEAPSSFAPSSTPRFVPSFGINGEGGLITLNARALLFNANTSRVDRVDQSRTDFSNNNPKLELGLNFEGGDRVRSACIEWKSVRRRQAGPPRRSFQHSSNPELVHACPVGGVCLRSQFVGFASQIRSLARSSRSPPGAGGLFNAGVRTNVSGRAPAVSPLQPAVLRGTAPNWLTQGLRAGSVRLAALLSGGSVAEAEEAGFAIVVSEALLALLLAVDREAGTETCLWHNAP